MPRINILMGACNVAKSGTCRAHYFSCLPSVSSLRRHILVHPCQIRQMINSSSHLHGTELRMSYLIKSDGSIIASQDCSHLANWPADNLLYILVPHLFSYLSYSFKQTKLQPRRALRNPCPPGPFLRTASARHMPGLHNGIVGYG